MNACMNHLLCHCLLKTDYKLLYALETIAALRKHNVSWAVIDIWIPYFVNVWFQKLKYLYPLHGRLFDLHPPPPGFSVPGGFWWPPSPQEFSRIFKRLPTWVPEVFLACGRNFRCRPKADTSSARVSLTILWKFKVVLVLKNKESEY